MIDMLSGLGINLGANLGINTQPQFWVSVVEIIWINVLLSGDNAIVIALACRGLAPKQRLVGMVLGTGVALLLRVVFTSVVVTLMFVPYLKIAGGAALFWISLKLLAPDELKSTEESGKKVLAPNETVLRAVTVIAVADIVMSLDNVIAVAAAANGNFAMLIFGLAVSIPVIVAGATLFMAIVNYFPLIIWAGAAVLGWLAGDLIATDPIVLEGAKAFGPTAHEKIALAFSIVGATGTLLGGLLVRRVSQPLQV
jgi:YjbE family integral membrane protein